MKRDMRIKICQENTKARDLRRTIHQFDGDNTFKMRKELEYLNKKVEFLKKASKYLEKRG